MDSSPSFHQIARGIPARKLNSDNQTVQLVQDTERDDIPMADQNAKEPPAAASALVANIIFRVPKIGFLVPGTVFEAMFSLPTMEGITEGSNVENPIELPVNLEKFRGFLRVMYPFSGIQIQTDDWLGALDLSTMWMFDDMRQRAIQALDPWIAEEDAKEVVLLAKKYRILKWLKDGYTRLLQQPSQLTAPELRGAPSFDWETIAKLLSTKLRSGSYYDSRSISLMEQEFEEEFSCMSDA